MWINTWNGSIDLTSFLKATNEEYMSCVCYINREISRNSYIYIGAS